MHSFKKRQIFRSSLIIRARQTFFSHRDILTASAVNGLGFIIVTASNILWYYLIVRNYSGVDSGNLLLAMSVAGLINLLDLGTSMGLIRIMSMSELPAHKNMAFAAFEASIWIGLTLQLFVGAAALHPMVKVCRGGKFGLRR